TKPFPFTAMMALERLSVTAIIGAAGSIADMADGRTPSVLLHDAVVLGQVVEAESLDDGADLLVSIENLLAAGVVGAEAGGKLAAVLKVQEDSWHQAGDLLRS